MFDLIRPLIFKFSPEVAHSLAIKSLKLNKISLKIPDEIEKLEIYVRYLI